MSLLEIHDLKVNFNTDDGVVEAVDGASFSVERGKTLGIVGESGCGKSVANMTILGLTRSPRTTISGRILLEGRDLNEMSADDLRGVRGREIAMIFQDPLTSMHPFYRVGKQLIEAMQAHQDVSKAVAKRRAVELLGLVGIPDPERRVDDYPHEFSGGMRQRAMIAMALALNPDLLIADEPTTARDVTVQAQILDLIDRLKDEFEAAVVLITHDLGVVAEHCDDIVVMYAGKAVEYGERRDIYYDSHHPYTWGLMQSISRIDQPREERLRPIKGQPPSLINVPSGCAFHPRCPYVMDPICKTDVPALLPANGHHASACHLSLAEKERIVHEEVLVHS